MNFLLFALVSAHVHGKALSVCYDATHLVIFKQLIVLSSKAHFSTDLFHEIMWMTAALKRNAHVQNEHTIPKCKRPMCKGVDGSENKLTA